MTPRPTMQPRMPTTLFMPRAQSSCRLFVFNDFLQKVIARVSKQVPFLHSTPFKCEGPHDHAGPRIRCDVSELSGEQKSFPVETSGACVRECHRRALWF